MATTLPRKPRCTKPIPTPTVELLSWDGETGTGYLSINGTAYSMTRLKDNGRTVGCRLAKAEADGFFKLIDVDFTAAHGWQCDCECAVYDQQRGPCKHCQALRLVGPQIRAAEDAAYAEQWAVSELRR